MSERNHLINRRDAAPTPTGFAEIVSDYFPVFFHGCNLPHAPRRAALASSGETNSRSQTSRSPGFTAKAQTVCVVAN
jgi:hypothetical protein